MSVSASESSDFNEQDLAAQGTGCLVSPLAAPSHPLSLLFESFLSLSLLLFCSLPVACSASHCPCFCLLVCASQHLLCCVLNIVQDGGNIPDICVFTCTYGSLPLSQNFHLFMVICLCTRTADRKGQPHASTVYVLLECSLWFLIQNLTFFKHLSPMKVLSAFPR